MTYISIRDRGDTVCHGNSVNRGKSEIDGSETDERDDPVSLVLHAETVPDVNSRQGTYINNPRGMTKKGMIKAIRRNSGS